jgi:hypothetical protein
LFKSLQYNFLSNKKPSGESALRAAKRADGTDKFLGNKKELFQEIEKQLLNVVDLISDLLLYRQ